MVRGPVASLAGVGRWGPGRGSSLDQEPGFRAQSRGAMPLAALRGACAASGLAPRGGGTLDGLRCCLWFRSGSLVASLRLGIPRRSAGVKSMPPPDKLVGGGFVWHGLDTVGPSWAAVCADATRDPEPTSLGGGHLLVLAAPAAADVGGVVRDRCPNPTGGRFRIPRRVGGRSQSARAGGVQPDGTGPQQRVIRLDSTRPG